MKKMKEIEMLRHVDYDADKVETYLMFQKAFGRDDKIEIVEEMKFALKFIAEREQEWTLVIFKEEGLDSRELEEVAADFFTNLD